MNRLLIVVLILSSVTVHAATQVPHTFADGDVISASKFNDNFDALETAIDNVPAGPQGALPVGTMLMYGAASAPSGFLLCDGSAVSRTTYADLFAVIGTTYGPGDGSTTFHVPNFTNRFPLGGSAVGSIGGADSVTLTTSELPAHTHTGSTDSNGAHTHSIADPGHTHSVSGTLQTDGNHTVGNPDSSGVEPNLSGTVVTTSAASTTGISINSGGTHDHNVTTASTGGGQAFAIKNPYLVVQYIIKF